MPSNSHHKIKLLLNSTYWIMALVYIVIASVAWVLEVQISPFVYIFLGSYLAMFLFQIISSRFYMDAISKSPQAIAQYYMIHMLSRFVFGGIVAGIGSWIASSQYKTFLFCFGLYFLITLAYESYLFVRIEKYIYAHDIKK